MKKISFLILTFCLFIFASILKADNNISLKNYLNKKNIEEGSTQIYLLNRCRAVYTYASAVILKTDPVNSKKFIDIANSLLFKSVELRIIDSKDKQEIARKKSEKERKKLFEDYTEEGKKNWNKNRSYFKGTYIIEDMAICEKLVKEQ